MTIPEEVPIPMDIPVVDETPIAMDIPVAEEAPVVDAFADVSLEDLPLEDGASILDDTPIFEETPVFEEVPAEETPIDTDLPLGEDLPISEEVPVDTASILDEASVPDDVSLESILAEEPVLEAAAEEISFPETEAGAEPAPSMPLQPPMAVSEPVISVEEIVGNMLGGAMAGSSGGRGLEIAIGESGSSYIAFTLSPEKISKTTGLVTSGDVPVMLMGNFLSIAYEETVIRKNLLTGDTNTRTLNSAITSTINHTLANSSLANALIIQQKAGLAEVLDQILALSDEPDRINQIN
ncbi:MAG: hypothetical protein K6G23_00545, partial [Lachnospiraceae bacterium]|nr:hypothetical protein [Lachnospiraceae bacterium]